MLKQYPVIFVSERRMVFLRVENLKRVMVLIRSGLRTKLSKSVFGIRVGDSSSQPGSGGTESAVGWECCC